MLSLAPKIKTSLKVITNDTCWKLSKAEFLSSENKTKDMKIHVREGKIPRGSI